MEAHFCWRNVDGAERCYCFLMTIIGVVVWAVCIVDSIPLISWTLLGVVAGVWIWLGIYD